MGGTPPEQSAERIRLHLISTKIDSFLVKFLINDSSLHDVRQVVEVLAPLGRGGGVEVGLEASLLAGGEEVGGGLFAARHPQPPAQLPRHQRLLQVVRVQERLITTTTLFLSVFPD